MKMKPWERFWIFWINYFGTYKRFESIYPRL